MSFDLDAYCARIGVARPATPDVATLDALVRAHVMTIPFENLDVLLGRPIRLEVDAVFAQLVTARRGGYCFQHNTLFAAVLRTLGYRVVPLAGRVGEERRLASRTHMLLEVEAEGRAWLVDVGFGGHTPVRAIPLAVGTYPSTHGTLALREDGDAHLALELVGVETLYWFTREEQYAIDYEVANHYTATAPGSYFVTSPRLGLITRDGYRGFADGQLSERRNDGTATKRAPVDFGAMLRDSFGLDLPDALASRLRR